MTTAASTVRSGQLPTTSPRGIHWCGLAVLLIAEAMNLLDSTIITVASPAIRTDLGGGDSAIQWLTAAYTLPFAVLLILGGRLGDVCGRRAVFRWGVAVFTASSMACAVAPVMTVLVGCRAAQGAAAALVIPQTIGLIKAVFTGGAMARALSTIGPVMGIAAVLGPVVGGVLLDADLFGTGWRAVFLVNVPVGCAVLIASVVLPENRARMRPRLDVTGAVLIGAGVSAVVYPLVEGRELHWPAWLLVLPAVGVATIVAAIRHMRRRVASGQDPLFELGLLRSRGFAASMLTSTAFFAVVTGLVLVVAVQLQTGAGCSALRTAGVLCPWSIGLALASLTAGRVLYPRYGFRLLPVGGGVMLLGIVVSIVAYLADGGVPIGLMVALSMCGIGYGLFSVPFFTIALAGVQPHETGSAAGLLNAVQQLGATLGVAILATVFFAGDVGNDNAQRAAAGAFAVAFVLMVGALVTARRMRPKRLDA